MKVQYSNDFPPYFVKIKIDKVGLAKLMNVMAQGRTSRCERIVVEGGFGHQLPEGNKKDFEHFYNHYPDLYLGVCDQAKKTISIWPDMNYFSRKFDIEAHPHKVKEICTHELANTLIEELEHSYQSRFMGFFDWRMPDNVLMLLIVPITSVLYLWLYSQRHSGWGQRFFEVIAYFVIGLAIVALIEEILRSSWRKYKKYLYWNSKIEREAKKIANEERLLELAKKCIKVKVIAKSDDPRL